MSAHHIDSISSGTESRYGRTMGNSALPIRKHCAGGSIGEAGGERPLTVRVLVGSYAYTSTGSTIGSTNGVGEVR